MCVNTAEPTVKNARLWASYLPEISSDTNSDATMVYAADYPGVTDADDYLPSATATSTTEVSNIAVSQVDPPARVRWADKTDDADSVSTSVSQVPPAPQTSCLCNRSLLLHIYEDSVDTPDPALPVGTCRSRRSVCGALELTCPPRHVRRVSQLGLYSPVGRMDTFPTGSMLTQSV